MEMSFREKFRRGTFALGFVHMGLYFFARSFEYWNIMMFLLGAAIAGGFFMLCITKPTLENEESQTSAYKYAYWIWGISSLLFLFGVIDPAR
ncbi:MAG: hypothetical protein E4H14_03030 [Candidatus Thorarchaeota archaeon]|nr:MAG: hypothetical protein E4H14_03030 [Candidatus Thorarchaeota archaeon]